MTSPAADMTDNRGTTLAAPGDASADTPNGEPADSGSHSPESKPVMRGMLHMIAFPVSVLAGIILIVFAKTGSGRVACTIYTFAIAMLFGVSATYHRGHWSQKVWLALKRWDHADIYVAIAGSYTPVGVLLLRGDLRTVMLCVVWSGALGGIGLSAWWPAAPRPVLVPTYIVVGWSALVTIPEMLHRGGVAFLVLTLTGGALYTCGGLVYALRRPNPSPRYFGFHEVFHGFTIAAYILQYIAISMAAYRL